MSKTTAQPINPAGFITGVLASPDSQLELTKTAGGRWRIMQDGNDRMTRDGSKAEAEAALASLRMRQEDMGRELAEAREAQAAARDAGDGTASAKAGAKVTDLGNPDAPLPTPAQAADKPSVEQVAQQLPAKLREYAEAHASTDPAAPATGLPFMTNGRLYLALNGQPGLVEFLDSNGAMAGLGKRLVSAAVQHLGAKRQPYSYTHPTKGMTSAGYWWLPMDVVGEVNAEALQPKRRATREPVSASSIPEPTPMMPDGSEKDTKTLRRLWDEYNSARDTLRSSYGKASDEKKAEYRTALQDAHQALLAHRRAMQAKLDAKQPTA